MAEGTDVENLPVVHEVPQLAEIEDLDENAVERINHLFQIMSANPAGFEGDVKWRPEKLKIRHPITQDPTMPPDAEVGDLFGNGKVLWSRQDDGRSNPFKFVLCYAWQSRARFPTGANQPDCTSADSVWNDHGTMKCENCPDLPFRNGQPTDCHNTLNMVILPVDLSGIYVVRFSKSSYKAGSNIRKMLRGCLHTWDRMFGLTTKEMSNASNTWNVFQSVAINEEVPAEVKAFAKHVSEAYKQIREEYLKSLEEARNNADEGLDAMANMGDDFDDDADGFDDTM